jgi:hypothetical protein
MLSDEEIWSKIQLFAKTSLGKNIPILNPIKGSPFIIRNVTKNHLQIDKIPIKMTRQMFLAVYHHLKDRGDWVPIGARWIGAYPHTVEGFIKKTFFDNNPDALSTATWFSAILVRSNIGVEFNNRAMGQKIRAIVN